MGPCAASRDTARVGVNAEVIKRTYAAFARRDLAALAELSDPELEFWPATARVAGREEPYRGRDGLKDYLDDVARLWEELRIEPDDFREVDDLVVVTGRVYAWGAGRVIDAPAGWVWRVRDARIVWGRVFDSRRQALAAAGLA
jgi:ketosteroid isomerase-like protein